MGTGAKSRLSARQRAALDAMGITRWVPRAVVADAVTAPSCPGPTARSIASAPPTSATTEDWERLRREVAACTRCGLHATRTQTVFGVGNPSAQWMVIGEAPGAEEDRQGEPFVGRAGQLLNEMLRAAGLAREQVYIANILKCRPPENRDPTPDESVKCQEFLRRQIELVQPRLLLAVGRIAAQNLLATDTPIGRLRGRVHHYGPLNTPVVVTYHPAYLLRSPGQKRQAWQDLLLAKRVASAATG